MNSYTHIYSIIYLEEQHEWHPLVVTVDPLFISQVVISKSRMSCVLGVLSGKGECVGNPTERVNYMAGYGSVIDTGYWVTCWKNNTFINPDSLNNIIFEAVTTEVVYITHKNIKIIEFKVLGLLYTTRFANIVKTQEKRESLFTSLCM